MPTTTDFETLKVQLLPRLQSPSAGPERVLVPGHLHVGLVLETLDGDVEVDQEDLDRWNVGFGEALEIALDNLRGRSSPSGWQAVDTVPGMYFYLPGTTDASLRALILADLLDQWPMEGVLFAVPSPNQLLIVPLTSMVDLSAVRVLVTSAFLANQSATNPLSNQIFWADGGEVSLIRVLHDGDDVQVIPTPAFLQVIDRLSSMSLISAAGEA